MQVKSNVQALILAFIQFVDNAFNIKIVSVQTEWGGEFQFFNPLALYIGLRVQSPHSHPQNRSVEHRHHHIIEIGLSLLSHASVPIKYWANAFQTAIFLINSMPTPLVQSKSPFEVLMGKIPD